MWTPIAMVQRHRGVIEPVRAVFAFGAGELEDQRVDQPPFGDWNMKRTDRMVGSDAGNQPQGRMNSTR